MIPEQLTDKSGTKKNYIGKLDSDFWQTVSTGASVVANRGIPEYLSQSR